MNKAILLIFTSLLLMSGCESKKPAGPNPNLEPKIIIDAEPEPLKEIVEEENLEEFKSLIFNTKMSISAKRPDWVLFSNGTYILFPKGTSEDDMRQSAFGFLQRYNNESLTISKSPLVKGWIAESRKGVYNYISLDQAGSTMIKDSELASLGKSNIQKDKGNPIIVHVNTAK